MANPQNGTFNKLTTTDTTANSLVVGAATANGTTGTGGIKAGPVACATLAATTSATIDTGTVAGSIPSGVPLNAIHQMTGTTDKTAGLVAVKSAIDASTIQALMGYAYNSNAIATTLALSYAVVGNAEHAGAGSVTSLAGMSSNVFISSSGGGTDAIAFNAAMTGRSGGGAGTFTNAYALKIGTYGAGLTNKYSVFSSDATAMLSHAGSIGIGVAPVATKSVFVQGTTTGASDYALYLQDSASAGLTYVRNDGLINTGTRTNAPFNNTTAQTGIVIVDNTGSLYRYTNGFTGSGSYTNFTIENGLITAAS